MGVSTLDAFVARQPIFNRNNKVVAYEILFRSSHENLYSNNDGDKATLDVIINTISTIGIDVVTSGKKAFINFTDKLLKDGTATIISPQIVTVEILEDVEPTDEIIMACKELKRLGYTLALDDFIFDEKYKTLIELADIIKVDFKLTKGEERKKVFELVNSKKVKFLAEKIEDLQEFEEAVAYGYSFFQGYYFSKPIIISAKEIPSYKFVGLKILQELNKSDIDIKKLEKFILRDVSLSYKLLRLINSTAFGLKNKVSSIKYAISLLGEIQIIKWLYIILIKDIGKDKNDELLNNSLIRAKFLELLSKKTESAAYDAYITGMLSLMDTILGRPIDEIVRELYLSIEVNNALLGGDSKLGSLLKLAVCYEKAEWDKVIGYSSELSINSGEVTEAYIQAIKWVKSF